MEPNLESSSPGSESDDNDPIWLLGIAAHEAAHAVAAVVHGIDLISVDIRRIKEGPDARRGCAVSPMKTGRTRNPDHRGIGIPGPLG
jgi:hypothetical protein